MAEIITQFGSSLAGFMFLLAIFRDFFPPQILTFFQNKYYKLLNYFNPYVQITFPELSGERLNRSSAYSAIQNYLTTKSTANARRLNAEAIKGSRSLILTIDANEEIFDEYNGIKISWSLQKTVPRATSISFYPTSNERKSFTLTFHSSAREIITHGYIDHVLKQGKSIATQNRERKLFTNNPSQRWDYYNEKKWSHIVFEHPASFDTLAMEAKKKEEIKNDLIKFSKSKDYYAKIGKSWKRGYLLYGPPGTGKSTMIAAMANFLSYDIYDLELTTVKDNTELRRLLIETTNKSIIVIEDIDCSLNLTGQRKKKENKSVDDDDDDEKTKDPVSKEEEEEEEEEKEKEKNSKVTLSGLLNFIDGLWSACGGERIIIFTTNFVDKLDPALIRRGRMDKHIEMSYCCFEAFKVLAKNYLDVESHHLFGTIEGLLSETNVSPADVAENLMPKSVDEDPEFTLNSLIGALEKLKEEEGLRKVDEVEAS